MIQTLQTANSCDVVVYQNRNIRRSNCCHPKGPWKFTWDYREPTPELIQRGLTPEILKSIVSEINNKINNNISQRSCFKSIWWLLLLIPIAAIIILATTESIYFLSPVIMFAMFFSICIWYCWLRKLNKIYQENIKEMRKYINVTLNQEWYQTKGVKWMVFSEMMQITTTRNGKVQTDHYELFHVGITAIKDFVAEDNNHQSEYKRDAVYIEGMEIAPTVPLVDSNDKHQSDIKIGSYCHLKECDTYYVMVLDIAKNIKIIDLFEQKERTLYNPNLILIKDDIKLKEAEKQYKEYLSNVSLFDSDRENGLCNSEGVTQFV